MIEKISLPTHTPEPRRGTFEITNNIRQEIFALGSHKHVEVSGINKSKLRYQRRVM